MRRHIQKSPRNLFHAAGNFCVAKLGIRPSFLFHMGGDSSMVIEIQGPDREEIARQLFPNYPNEIQIARFLGTLGRAITHWQLVETELYEVYEAAVSPGRPGAAASGFHAI